MVQPGPLSASFRTNASSTSTRGMGVLVPFHRAAGFEHHVIEDGAVVRLGDAGGGLHGLGREADLAPDQRPAGFLVPGAATACCTA